MVWSGCQGELLFQEEPRAKPLNRPCRLFHIRRIIRHDRRRHRVAIIEFVVRMACFHLPLVPFILTNAAGKGRHR
jgi:hypothetical protein